MFGRRPDGIAIKNMDPIVMMTPYFMPMRVDAQVFLDSEIKYENIVNYIANKANDGFRVSFMDIIIASYVRGVSSNPEINRFIMNKKLYARKELTVSLTILKDNSLGNFEETVVKIFFDPHDTLLDVSARIRKAIDESRKEELSNVTLKLASFLMKTPGMPNLIVGLSKLLDRYGLLPKALIDAIPFHTSMFFTNVASIGLERVYHHVYNYGTTSLFLSMGNIKKNITVDNRGNVKKSRVIPLGITVDERVCGGAVYSSFFASIRKYFDNPELLDMPPENVRYDDGCIYSRPKPDYECLRITK